MDTVSFCAEDGNTSSLRSIPTYPGYYADADGNIYSAWTRGKYASIHASKRKKMHPIIGSNNYQFVGLKIETIKGKYYRTGVHRLVCLAFYGIPPKGYTASHRNGNRQDNRVSNLLWESMPDNVYRKREHGTYDGGYHNSRAKIDKATLEEIRLLLKEGKLTHQQIGELFGVNRVFITKINTGERYKAV